MNTGISPHGRPVRAVTADTRRTSGAAAGMRLSRRGRRVVAALATAVMLTVLSGIGAMQASADDRSRDTAVIVVGPGQTLWEIAQVVAPGADPRETIYRIQRLNHMSTSDLAEGQELVVPASS